MKEKYKKRAQDEEDHGRDEREDDTGEHELTLPDEAATGEEDGPEPVIEPVEKSIGEGRDNLRQRESWFRRRSGIRS